MNKNKKQKKSCFKSLFFFEGWVALLDDDGTDLRGRFLHVVFQVSAMDGIRCGQDPNIIGIQRRAPHNGTNQAGVVSQNLSELLSVAVWQADMAMLCQKRCRIFGVVHSLKLT